MLDSGNPARCAGLFGTVGLTAWQGWAGPAEPPEPSSALGVLRGRGSASGPPAPGGFVGWGKAAAEQDCRGGHLMTWGLTGKGWLDGDKEPTEKGEKDGGVVCLVFSSSPQEEAGVR